MDASLTTNRIAERERCSLRKVNMTISLAFLAPDLVKAAIDGRLPYGCSTVASSRNWMTSMRGISAASRGTAVLRNWTRPRPSRKRITTPDGIGEASLNVRPPLPAGGSS
jgi:hypothetical protein